MSFKAFAILTLCTALPAFAARHQKLTVHLTTATGEDAGTATFEQESPTRLEVKLKLKNLPAGEHAVHIHAAPHCDAPDFKTAGGHFNPESKMHGFSNPMGHHAGDLPQNLAAGSDLTVAKTFTLDYLTLGTGAPNDILANGGTSIIVHAGPDDMKTDPSGNSGARLACGIITGIRMPKPMEQASPAPGGAVKPN